MSSGPVPIVHSSGLTVDVWTTGPTVLVAHSWAGTVISETGADPKVTALLEDLRYPAGSLFVPGRPLPEGTELVAITNDPDEAARAPMGDALVADVRLTLEALVAALPETERPAPEARPAAEEVELTDAALHDDEAAEIAHRQREIAEQPKRENRCHQQRGGLPEADGESQQAGMLGGAGPFGESLNVGESAHSRRTQCRAWPDPDPPKA